MSEIADRLARIEEALGIAAPQPAASPMLTTADASAILGVTPQQVRTLCQRGRIRGAIRHGRDWLIPDPPERLPPPRPRGRQPRVTPGKRRGESTP